MVKKLGSETVDRIQRLAAMSLAMSKGESPPELMRAIGQDDQAECVDSALALLTIVFRRIADEGYNVDKWMKAALLNLEEER